jgi:hypothetical protein
MLLMLYLIAITAEAMTGACLPAGAAWTGSVWC